MEWLRGSERSQASVTLRGATTGCWEFCELDLGTMFEGSNFITAAQDADARRCRLAQYQLRRRETLICFWRNGESCGSTYALGWVYLRTECGNIGFRRSHGPGIKEGQDVEIERTELDQAELGERVTKTLRAALKADSTEVWISPRTGRRAAKGS